MIHPTNPTAVAVKRKGRLGYHWIAAESFNPDVHEVYDWPKDGKPSDSLTVAQLKAALEEKGIEVPEGAKKAALAELLDAAVADEGNDDEDEDEEGS